MKKNKRKTMKIFILLLFLSFSMHAFAQGGALNTGSQYVGRSAGFIGYDYRISSNSSRIATLNVGAGTYLTSVNKKFTVIPELHSNYSFYSSNLTELSVSTKNIKPSVGLNILNIMQIKFGYGFSFQKEKYPAGFCFGLNICFGSKRFYDIIPVVM
jgi:hypothetical protein